MKLAKIDNFNDLNALLKHPQTALKKGFLGGRYTTFKNITTPSGKKIHDKVSLNVIVRQLEKICELQKKSFDDEKLTSIIEICAKIKALDLSLKSTGFFTRIKRIRNARIFGGNPKKEILKEKGAEQFISKYFKLVSLNSITTLVPPIPPKKPPVNSVIVPPNNSAPLLPSPAAKTDKQTPSKDDSKKPCEQLFPKVTTSTCSSQIPSQSFHVPKTENSPVPLPTVSLEASTQPKTDTKPFTVKRKRSKGFIERNKDRPQVTATEITKTHTSTETPISPTSSVQFDAIKINRKRPTTPQTKITKEEIDRIADVLEEDHLKSTTPKNTAAQIELDCQRIDAEASARLKKCILSLEKRFEEHKIGVVSYDQPAFSQTYTHDELIELEKSLIEEYQQLFPICNGSDPELLHKSFRCTFVQIQKKLSDFLEIFVLNTATAHVNEDAFHSLVLSFYAYEEFLKNLEWLPDELKSLPEICGENPYDFDEKAGHRTQLELALPFYRQNYAEMKLLLESLMIVNPDCCDFLKKGLGICSPEFQRDLTIKYNAALALVKNTPNESPEQMKLLTLSEDITGLDWALYEVLNQIVGCVEKDDVESFKALKQEFLEFYTPFQNEYFRWSETVCNTYSDSIPENIQKDNAELNMALNFYRTKLSYLNALAMIWE